MGNNTSSVETAQQRQSRQDVIEQQRQLEREQEKARLAQEQREQRQRQLQEEEEQRRQQLQRQWQALETGVSIEVLPPSKPYWLGRDFELSLKIVNGRSREIASGSELVCEQTKYNNPKMTVLRSAVGKWTSSAPDPISINVECKSCPPFESWRDAWEALPNEFQFTLIEHREHGELLTNLRVPVSFSWFLGALSDPVAYYNILCFGGANQGKSSSIQTQLTMSCAREVLKGWVVTSGTVEHGTKIYNLHHKLPCPLRFFDTKGVLASEAGSPGKQQYPVHTLNHMIEGKLPLGSDIGMTEQLMALEQRARLATDVPLVGTPAQFVAQTAAAKPEEVDPLNRIHAMALFVPYEDFMPERVESDTAAAHCEMYKDIIAQAARHFVPVMVIIAKVDMLDEEMRKHPDEPTSTVKDVMAAAADRLGVQENQVLCSVNYTQEHSRTWALDKHVFRITMELKEIAEQFCEKYNIPPLTRSECEQSCTAVPPSLGGTGSGAHSGGTLSRSSSIRSSASGAQDHPKPKYSNNNSGSTGVVLARGSGSDSGNEL